MVSRAENELLTRTGPGTPGGELMRKYWHPVALTEELPPDSAPIPVRILGEDLVLFRDDKGRVGLVGILCPHRCADLSYGRVEDGGLRCLYHGWLFDVDGRCLDQPAEPEDSKYKDEIRHTAYKCVERAGMIFAYLGKDPTPLFPEYEFLSATEEHRFLVKTHLDSNWLQAIEGNIDPSHLSYLHKPMAPVDSRAVPGSDKSADAYYRDDTRPKLEIERTDYGVRNYSIRNAGDKGKYLRVTNFIMPNKAAIVGNEGRVGQGYSLHWHVPIDDEHNMRFDFIFNRARPIDRSRYNKHHETERTPDNRHVRNLSNRYLQDRELMKTSNYTGMGDYFPVHDAFATETMGAIVDRTKEHLGATDVCIVAARRTLLNGIAAVQAGKDPIHVFRDPAENDCSNIVVVSEVIPADMDHKEFWKQRVQKKAPVSV